jgi:hypothetical protein
MKELLIKLRACEDAREWAGDKTIEEIVEQCHRGDWLLWLAAKIGIGSKPLTLAKGHCANTVRHLMKDGITRKAVNTAIAFGEGRATVDELNAAAAAAADAGARAASYDPAARAACAAAAYYAADHYASAYYAAAHAADVDAHFAFRAAYHSAASATASTAAHAAAAYAAASASKQNQKDTADICRKYIGQLIIDKCNQLNTI